MITKTITYKDYNGETRTETFYFHLNKAEVLKMNYSHGGNLQAYLEKIMKTKNEGALIDFVEEMILKAYGVKSEDGLSFIKHPEETEKFKQSEAFSELFVEMLSDGDAAEKFVYGVVPPEIAAGAQNSADPMKMVAAEIQKK